MSSALQLYPRREDLQRRLRACKLTYSDVSRECSLSVPIIASRIAGYRKMLPAEEAQIVAVIQRYEKILHATGLRAFNSIGRLQAMAGGEAHK